VGLKVTDPDGLSGSARAVVTVADTRAPDLALRATPEVLWPPDHRLVPVRAEWRVEDACDPEAAVALSSYSSSEPDDAAGEGDGHTTGDVAGAAIGTADDLLLLRAERAAGGAGRVYRLVYAARDASGNETTCAAEVVVPLSRAGRSLSRSPFHRVDGSAENRFTPQQRR
jgi:hypothetical protein